MNHSILFAICTLLLTGEVLHGANVTVGNGSVIDWRTVKSGDEIAHDLDAFDSAALFVALVGPEVATKALAKAVAFAESE